MNKRVLESLVKAGALDSLAPPLAGGADPLPTRQLRARLMSALDAAVEHAARYQRDRDLGQADLFGGGGEGPDAADRTNTLPAATAWTEIEQLTYEKEALGLYWSGHPIDSYAADLKEFGAKTIADLLGHDAEPAQPAAAPPMPVRSSGQRGGDETSAGGVVTAVRPLKTRKGDRMAVFFLEDRHGSIEVLAFKDTYARAAALIENGTLVVVRGKLERDDEEARLLASDILPIAAVREKLARELAITLAMPPHTRATLEALADLFARNRGDKPVTLHLELKNGASRMHVQAQVSSHIRVKASAAFLDEVKKICGERAVALR